MIDRIGNLRSEMQAQLRAQTGRLITAVALIVGIAEAIGRVG